MNVHLTDVPSMHANRARISRHDSLIGTVGTLEVRLAKSRAEIVEAQQLRHRIFLQERGLVAECGKGARDHDRFDRFCDHLIVADRADNGRIVGTYRLLRQDMAMIAGGFYSEAYFDVARLARQNPGKSILELGRSCVEPEYRTKRTVELLWHGIWAYCRMYGIDVLTGCASFDGDDPFAHAQTLTFLAHHCQPEAQWNTSAVPGRRHPMMLCDPFKVDPKSAFLALPPLLKGYLRVGAKIADGCVADHAFKTTVVLVVLPVDVISERYRRHFA